MLRFAQDLRTCRKIAFANVRGRWLISERRTERQYFSASSSLSAAAWDSADTLAASGGAITPCGICDNCTRDPASVTVRNVTVEAWKTLKVIEAVVRKGGRATLANLADLVRGLGGGNFGIPSSGKRKREEPEKSNLDLAELIDGKISLNKDVSDAHRTNAQGPLLMTGH